jgi:hypothetical protein
MTLQHQMFGGKTKDPFCVWSHTWEELDNPKYAKERVFCMEGIVLDVVSGLLIGKEEYLGIIAYPVSRNWDITV